jgi:Tfp pilus assembly protein PilF
LNSNDTYALVSRGNAWLKKGNPVKAIADYTEAIWLDPKSPDGYYNRAIAWAKQGELDHAIEDYSEAIRLDPSDAGSYSGRASIWIRKKLFEKAIQDYTEAVRIDPNRADIFDYLAWMQATCPDSRCRDGIKAIKNATASCELSDWKNPGFLQTLAAAYAEARDFEKAIEWQKKAIELAPNESTKDDYKTRLALYRENRPYREIPGQEK